MQNQANSPMQPKWLAETQRFLARTRSGMKCQSSTVKGKRRCRMHGGSNSGAPKGNQNARKHGSYSAGAKATVGYLKMMARLLKERELRWECSELQASLLWSSCLRP
jgi:hypothetical protein